MSHAWKIICTICNNQIIVSSVWHMSFMHTEPPSSDQESKPTIDVKPKLELASPTDEKPTITEVKTEPVSPDKKDIKPEQVKPDNEQGEESLLKENALLREIVAYQRKQIAEYQETKLMYNTSLQGNWVLDSGCIVCSIVKGHQVNYCHVHS